MWPGCSISDSSQGAILPAALTPQCASLSPDLSQPPAEQCTAVDGGQTGDGLMCPGTSPPPPPKGIALECYLCQTVHPDMVGHVFQPCLPFLLVHLSGCCVTPQAPYIALSREPGSCKAVFGLPDEQQQKNLLLRRTISNTCRWFRTGERKLLLIPAALHVSACVQQCSAWYWLVCACQSGAQYLDGAPPLLSLTTIREGVMPDKLVPLSF